MPITFNYLLNPNWEYEFYSKRDDHIIILAHDEAKFIEELQKYNVYDEYLKENKNDR